MLHIVESRKPLDRLGEDLEEAVARHQAKSVLEANLEISTLGLKAVARGVIRKGGVTTVCTM